MKRTILMLFLLFSLPALAFQSPFDVSWDTNKIRAGQGSEVKTDVIVRIPSGHFLYKDKTELSFTALEGVRVKAINYPPSVSHSDIFTGKATEIFPEGEMTVSVTFFVPKDLSEGEKQISAILEFQGCEEKLCLRPEEHSINWDLEISPNVNVIEEGPDAVLEAGDFSIRALLNVKDFKDVVSHGRYIAIFIALIAGLLTSFTPCVWPLIPITLLIIGVHRRGNFFGNLLLALSLVSGIALMYTSLGLLAVTAGKHIGFLFQQKLFLWLVVVFLISMSCSMFGLFTLQLPVRFQTLLTKLGGNGYRGAFLSGISLGLLATPCAGPLLAPMLLWVASQNEYLFGVQLLFIYSFGMGMVYVVIGTFYGTFSGRMKNVRIGGMVKKLLGVILLIPAFYYLTSLVPHNCFVSNGSKGSSIWISDEPAAVSEAVAQKKPLMIVFGAKWCPPCLKLESSVLEDERVKSAMAGIVPVHIDATTETADVKLVIDKYHVIGWPTILFVSPDGRVYEDLSLVGEVPSAEKMVELINKAIHRSADL